MFQIIFMLIRRSPSKKSLSSTRTRGFEKSVSQLKRSSRKIKMDPHGIQNLIKV